MVLILNDSLELSRGLLVVRVALKPQWLGVRKSFQLPSRP